MYICIYIDVSESDHLLSDTLDLFFGDLTPTAGTNGWGPQRCGVLFSYNRCKLPCPSHKPSISSTNHETAKGVALATDLEVVLARNAGTHNFRSARALVVPWGSMFALFNLFLLLAFGNTCIEWHAFPSLRVQRMDVMVRA